MQMSHSTRTTLICSLEQRRNCIKSSLNDLHSKPFKMPFLHRKYSRSINNLHIEYFYKTKKKNEGSFFSLNNSVLRHTTSRMHLIRAAAKISLWKLQILDNVKMNLGPKTGVVKPAS